MLVGRSAGSVAGGAIGITEAVVPKMIVNKLGVARKGAIGTLQKAYHKPIDFAERKALDKALSSMGSMIGE